jgi:cytochrome b6-f complex iron-sulfur subunit
MNDNPYDEEKKERSDILSQQYEAVYGARAEQRLARRRLLRRSILVAGGLFVGVSSAGALSMLYPGLTGQFGSALDIGIKASFPPATPDAFDLNRAGVFYQESARAFIIHLARETRYLLTGNALESQLADEWFTRDNDGSYWLALYRRCPHMGTAVAFRNECHSFKCPSHGAHFHGDGEYLDGPSPRNMDRFPLSLSNDHVFVDTSRLIQAPRTVDNAGVDSIPRLLASPGPCSM